MRFIEVKTNVELTLGCYVKTHRDMYLEANWSAQIDLVYE